MRVVFLLLLALPVACVERRLHIRTEPAGARVRVNGHDAGRSPCEWWFDHYGEALVEAELEGYEPRQVAVHLKIPWFQRPVMDFLTDVAYPGRIHDDHHVHIVLPPRRRLGAGDKALLDEQAAALAERARALREEVERP